MQLTLLRNLAKKCLPPVAVEFMRYARMERYLWLNKGLLAKNKKIAGSFTGGECFILATGPSIKMQNLGMLKGRNCITVSNFFVHPDFGTLKPIFHCIAPYHPPITEDAWGNWMLDLGSHLDIDTSVVFGLSDFKRSDKYFDGYQRYYLGLWASGDYIARNGVDLTGALLPPCSVSIQAIQLALGLGFSKILLLGFDHDYILHYRESRHFYDESKDAKVKGGYSEWDKSLVGDIGTIFESLAELWKQYRLLKSVAEKQNIQVINLTEGGFLDVFDRGCFACYR
jgi:hypothetical protein